MYSIWYGDGSRSFIGYSDIYVKKLLLPLPLKRSSPPIDTVLNNSWLNITEVLPTIVKRSSGTGYLVVWVEKDSLSVLRIAGVTCNDSLRNLSSKIVFVDFDSVKSYMSKPALFHKQNGNIVIVWEKDTTNFQASIYFQEFTEAGAPVSELKKVNDKPASGASSISADTDLEGNFIIIWEDGTNLDLIAQRYDSDMDKIGTNFRLNTQKSGTNIFNVSPCIRLKNRKIYTAWERFINGWPTVWMNILDFDNPTMVVKEPEEFPRTYFLSQNYPDPFNPTTTIEYNVPKESRIKIVVFDVLGREIKTLVDDVKPKGSYTLRFEANSLSSGVYFYRLQAGNFVSVKKMMIVK